MDLGAEARGTHARPFPLIPLAPVLFSFPPFPSVTAMSFPPLSPSFPLFPHSLSSFPFPSRPSLSPARGSGERYKLPQRGAGRSPSRVLWQNDIRRFRAVIIVVIVSFKLVSFLNICQAALYCYIEISGCISTGKGRVYMGRECFVYYNARSVLATGDETTQLQNSRGLP